ncbi:MAG TPA: hypothetical protein VJ841_04175 [Candidatus Saccharimonadales bacterium]|nr:hypothetical protein [Candidatus Saccharimonadales bacterium]
MGEAEDFLFKQERIQQAARVREEQREIAVYVEQAQKLIPKVVTNLRKHNYKLGGFRHDVIFFRGEDRVAWQLTDITDLSHEEKRYIRLLADGTIIREFDRAHQVADLSELSVHELKNVVNHLRAFAYYPKQPPNSTSWLRRMLG